MSDPLSINTLGFSADFLRCTPSRSSGFILALYKTHIRSLSEFASYLYNTDYIGDLKLLESVQRTWICHIEGMAGD